ncbi:RNI-like superfamily protein [Rhynchospora pubera]|uniref:RNI-like superfamily protein n=1 Tax=Rhynchospora pubera TaxID=906938 RepID=A0AAV8FN33_9POAL|nr:RNI-like superfamily protein [Rhynchospora pubera]
MGKSKRGKQKKFDIVVFPRSVLPKEKPVSLKERQWSELPSDILLKIFEKVGQINVLTKAIRVCRDWLEVARNDPILWRKVDMTYHGDQFGPNDLEDIACVAVNWSAGQLEEFSAEKFGSGALLQYIASRSSNLKCIRLIKSPVSRKTLKKVIKRCPLIEEIELTGYLCTPALCQAIGLLCPRLKCFRLNEISFYPGYSHERNSIANCIGITMPNLHSLQLISSRMTEKGLYAILEGCPQLESLDVRNCCNLSINERIESELERIKILRLPDDSIDDWKFSHHLIPYYFDYDYCDCPSCAKSDSDSDSETYFDIEYGHIMFQHWD